MSALSLSRSDLPEEIEKAIEAFEDHAFRAGTDDCTASIRDARSALTAAILSRLGEAEAQGTPASPSGSQASPEAPTDPRPSGVDPSRMQWQPIATAPREDEETILVCDARVAGGFHQVVWWDADSKQPEYRWDTSDGPKFHRDAFTHWMPLPAPPALSEAPPQGERDTVLVPRLFDIEAEEEAWRLWTSGGRHHENFVRCINAYVAEAGRLAIKEA